MRFFSGKISIFTPKIHDDFFLGFSDFPYLYCVKCRIWHFLSEKNHYFRKEFLDDTFFYSVRTFARIRQHYFSKYWGDGCMGRPPHQIFLGEPSPQSPLDHRPWWQSPRTL